VHIGGDKERRMGIGVTFRRCGDANMDVEFAHVRREFESGEQVISKTFIVAPEADQPWIANSPRLLVPGPQ
jgi:hypothetical protein